jgi:hypothetical protein
MIPLIFPEAWKIPEWTEKMLSKEKQKYRSWVEIDLGNFAVSWEEMKQPELNPFIGVCHTQTGGAVPALILAP